MDSRAAANTPPQSAQRPCACSERRPRRKWEVFPGKNRFFCDGRIIVARQSGVLPFTLGLIILTSGLFFIFDCPFLVEHLTSFIPVVGGVLFIFVVVSLLQTSLTDPGILPRATPDEAADIEKQIVWDGMTAALAALMQFAQTNPACLPPAQPTLDRLLITLPHAPGRSSSTIRWSCSSTASPARYSGRHAPPTVAYVITVWKGLIITVPGLATAWARGTTASSTPSSCLCPS